MNVISKNINCQSFGSLHGGFGGYTSLENAEKGKESWITKKLDFNSKIDRTAYQFRCELNANKIQEQTAKTIKPNRLLSFIRKLF